MNLVFLGAPGTGKGTQAVRLAKEYNSKHISTGDLLRAEMDKGSELGLRVKDIMARGSLVSDDIINTVIENGLEAGTSYILDGYPRTIAQAEFLDNFFGKMGEKLSFVINFILSEEEIIKRLTGRRKCRKCGKDYNLYFNPSSKGDDCEACGSVLYQRPDDKKEVIINRLKVYNEQTKPLLDYYTKKNILKNIEARRPIDQIFKDLCKVIQD
ncbi:adenylate kinase [bacterium]